MSVSNSITVDDLVNMFEQMQNKDIIAEYEKGKEDKITFRFVDKQEDKKIDKRMKQPTQKECRCWADYPNPMRKEKCKFYECVKKMDGIYRKTVCKLKEVNEDDD